MSQRVCQCHWESESMDEEDKSSVHSETLRLRYS